MSQNQFYFERSTLLNSITDPAKYQILYEKIPVVLVLGWAGSKDNNVRKYEQIYAKMGYHTIRFSPTNQLTFFNTSQHKQYAVQLLDLMKNELNLTKNPLITHFFSNACVFIIYQYILSNDAIEYDFFKRNQKSAIFDSAPGWAHSGLKFLVGIEDLVKNDLPSTFMAPVRYLLAGTFVGLISAYHYSTSGKHYFTNAFETLLNDLRPIPTLVFYSTRDKLISAERIKELIERRRSKGALIDSVVYDDCEHVMLYVKHPEDYSKHMYEHLVKSKVDMKDVLGDIGHLDLIKDFSLPKSKL